MKMGVSYTPTVSTESQHYISFLLINSIGKGMLDAAEAIAQMITSHLKSGALTPKSMSRIPQGCNTKRELVVHEARQLLLNS